MTTKAPQPTSLSFLLVGTSFNKLGEALLRHGLAQGAPVVLVAEPDNPYDSNAVRVEVERASITPTPTLAEALAGFGYSVATLPERVMLGHLGAKRETKAAQRASAAGHAFALAGDYVAWYEAPPEGTLAFAGSGDVLVRVAPAAPPEEQTQ